MAGGGGAMPALAKYARFMRYIPFLGFPILMFFPSGMTLYWCTVAGMQLLITLLSRSKLFKQMNNIDGYMPGTILHRQHIKQKELDIQAMHQRVKAEGKLASELKTPVHKSASTADIKGKLKVLTEGGKKIEVFTKKPKKHSN
jgi:YidC/Oxa1 family membrane protein insertase